MSEMLKCCYRNGRSPSDVNELLEYMKTEFGQVAVHAVYKGNNVGWYLDQRLVSILISKWIRQHGLGRVKMMPRKTNRDRSVTLPKC